MSIELSRETLDKYLAELSKQFRKLYKKAASAEIVLIGGASVLINYDFRNMTTDADAIIYAEASMKEAINFVRDKFNLPHGWLNDDFKNTKSYTEKLRGVAVYYKTFSNILQVRTVAAEYLIAMKAMSGRRYKFDLSDIIGILWEHEKRGETISRESIDRAVLELYEHQPIPHISKQLLDDIFTSMDYERIYAETREQEKQAKEVLLEFIEEYPNVLDGDNTDDIIAEIMRKKQMSESGLSEKNHNE